MPATPHIHVTGTDDAIVIKPARHQLYDESQIPQFETQAKKEAALTGAPSAEKRAVIFDFGHDSGIKKEVEFISTAGLAALTRILDLANSEGRSVRLTNMRLPIKDAFRVARFDQQFPIDDTVEIALKKVEKVSGQTTATTQSPTSSPTGVELTPSAREPWRNTAV